MICKQRPCLQIVIFAFLGESSAQIKSLFEGMMYTPHQPYRVPYEVDNQASHQN